MCELCDEDNGYAKQCDHCGTSICLKGSDDPEAKLQRAYPCKDSDKVLCGYCARETEGEDAMAEPEKSYRPATRSREGTGDMADLLRRWNDRNDGLSVKDMYDLINGLRERVTELEAVFSHKRFLAIK